MSLTVGFPNASAITIRGNSPSSVDALNEAASDTAKQGQGVESGEGKATGIGGGGASKAESGGSQQSIAVQVLLKRMQELQQQMREQQQQLSAIQATPYSSPEAKAAAVMSIQGQISDTSAALMQVTASLVKELTKSGNLIDTTA